MKIVEKYGAMGRPSPELETKSGRIQGERMDGVMRFLGIPYAQSIAGRNRFCEHDLPSALCRLGPNSVLAVPVVQGVKVRRNKEK